MAEQEKKQKESKRAERGAWATYNPSNHAEVAATGSEIAAYRLGNPRGWQVVPWPFGLTLDEAIAKNATARA